MKWTSARLLAGLLALPLFASLLSATEAPGRAAFRPLQQDVGAGERLQLRITVGTDTDVPVDLQRFEVFTPDARVVVHTSHDDVTSAPPRTRYFRGSIPGEPDSFAFLSSGGDVRGLIGRHGKVFAVGPDGRSSDSDLITREVLPSSAPARALGRTCGRSALPAIAPRAHRSSSTLALPQASFTSREYDIDVAVETDFEYRQLFGSTIEATDYIGDLFGAISAIYNRDFGLNAVVGFVSIYETAADPWTKGSPIGLLGELGTYWSNNHSGIARDTVHLLSGRDLGGGVAWISTVCGASDDFDAGNNTIGGAYGVSTSLNGQFSTSNPNLYWDLVEVSHEIGHNLSSDHTHCYNPPVDHCYNQEPGCWAGAVSVPPEKGTIMSYCHLLSGGNSNLKLIFGAPGQASEAVTDHVRAFVESKTGCLQDTTVARFRMAVPTASVGEGGTASLVVTRSGSLAGTASVDFAAADGTALAGSDYTATSGTLSFAASESAQTISLTTVDDAFAESSEALTVTLGNPVGAVLSSAVATKVTIIDNESTVSFSAASYSVNESAGKVTITVKRTGSLAGSSSVSYATSNGTAVAGTDYTTKSGSLAFAAGATSRTFAVVVANDTTREGLETVKLALTNPSGTTLGTSAATINIQDNETQVFYLNTTLYRVVEGTNTSLAVKVSRAAPTNVAASVTVFTANGTALAGSDYTKVSKVVTFGAGTASVNVVVPLLNDGAAEGSESFTVSLKTPTSGWALGTQRQALVIIKDDEVAPTVFFSPSGFKASEAAGQVAPTVERSGDTTGTITVTCATTATGTATAGTDFTAVSLPLTFAPGVLIQSCPVPISTDAPAEPNETIGLALSGPTGAVLGTRSTALATVVNSN